MKYLPAIWVIGFPKSGNTWVSYLFSYCCNIPFHNFGNPNGTPTKPRVLLKTSGNNHWDSINKILSVQKTHKMPALVPFQDGIVFYVIRDPRDVYVSYSFFMKSKNAGFKGRIRYFLLGLFGKKKQIKWVISQWENHINKWKDNSLIVVNYDQLLSEGNMYLEKLFNLASINISKDIIIDALNYFSFEKMSEGRKPGVGKSAHFFRKGISGDWKNHLTYEESELFNKSLEIYKEVIR